MTPAMTAATDEPKNLPLPQQLLYWARTRPTAVALRQKQFGVWKPISWAEYAQASRWFGLGLLSLGLQPGQSVAVLGENCKEWVFAQFGISLVGGITAGVYPTSPAPEVEYLLALSEAPIIVCADQEQLDKVLSIRERLPHLRAIVVIDPRGLRRYDRSGLHEFDAVVALGQQAEAKDAAELLRAGIGDFQNHTDGGALAEGRQHACANVGINSIVTAIIEQGVQGHVEADADDFHG